MKTLFAFLFGLLAFNAQAQETVTISGRVTDFDGNPIDKCQIRVLYSNFTDAYSVYSDSDGYYSIPGVVKGKYMAIYALRPEEYPRELKVAPDDMRLEFWAWNIIADRDLTINPRYHRLELYGTTVFKQNGGYPVMMVYTRPMSLGRVLSYEEEIYKDKQKTQEMTDMSAEPHEIEFKVYADDVLLTIRSVQPVEEYIGGSRQMAYLIYVDQPEKQAGKKYNIFRVEAYNKARGGEKGENVYFYEIPDFIKP